MYHFRFQCAHRLKSFGMPGGWQVSMKVMLRALDSVSAGDLIDPDSDQWSPGPAGSLQLVIRLESNQVAHLITPCANSVTELRYSRYFIIDAIDSRFLSNYRCHRFFWSNSKPNLITPCLPCGHCKYKWSIEYQNAVRDEETDVAEKLISLRHKTEV